MREPVSQSAVWVGLRFELYVDELRFRCRVPKERPQITLEDLCADHEDSRGHHSRPLGSIVGPSVPDDIVVLDRKPGGKRLPGGSRSGRQIGKPLYGLKHLLIET